MRRWAALAVGCCFALAGCHIDMWEQPKAKSQEMSNFFSDNQNTREPVPGTVQFEKPRADSAFYTGYVDGQLVKEFPVPVDLKLIKRGQERFLAMCSHCHGALGDGKGMIAQRGFDLGRPIADYHTDRLMKMPIGHFFDVITNGYGAMFPQAARVKPADRWAIAAYIRVLQFSQHASVDDLDATTRRALGLEGEGKDTGPLFETQTYPAQPSTHGSVEGLAGPQALPPSQSQPPPLSEQISHDAQPSPTSGGGQ